MNRQKLNRWAWLRTTPLMLITFCIFANKASAQNAEAKINVAAGAVAIFNPSLEVSLNDTSAIAFDYVGIFARDNYMGTGYPFALSMGTWGYRRYLNGSSHDGYFYGAEAGLFSFRMNKNIVPLVVNDHGDTYDVGYGYLFGFIFGYKYAISKRFSIEANISGGWHLSQHEGYTMSGVRLFDLNPSAEWLPYKAGIYLNYNIW